MIDSSLNRLYPPHPPTPHTHFAIFTFSSSFVQVKKTADKALDYIMDVSEEHAPKIRTMKFETYNEEWIQVILAN